MSFQNQGHRIWNQNDRAPHRRTTKSDPLMFINSHISGSYMSGLDAVKVGRGSAQGAPRQPAESSDNKKVRAQGLASTDPVGYLRCFEGSFNGAYSGQKGHV